MKRKVGFVYNGLLSSFIDKSIPLKDFEDLFNLDINFICLHRKKEIEDDLNNISYILSDSHLNFYPVMKGEENFEKNKRFLIKVPKIVLLHYLPVARRHLQRNILRVLAELVITD